MTGSVTGIRRRRTVAGRRETSHLPPDRAFYGQTLDSDADLERWVADIAIDMEVCFRDRPGYFNAAATNNFARYQYFVMHHVRSRNGLLDCQIRDFIPAYSNSIQRLNAMRYVANTATNRDQAVWATNQVNRLSALPTNQLNTVSWLEE